MKVIWTCNSGLGLFSTHLLWHTSLEPVPVSWYGALTGQEQVVVGGVHRLRAPQPSGSGRPAPLCLCCTTWRLVNTSTNLYVSPPTPFSGIPTDEEQATGLERRSLQALKHGKVIQSSCLRSHSSTMGHNIQYLFERTPTACWSLKGMLAVRRTPILCHALEPRGWWAVFVSQVDMCDMGLPYFVTKQLNHKVLFGQVRKTTLQLCGSGSMREKLSAVLPAAPTISWSTTSCLTETKPGTGSTQTGPTLKLCSSAPRCEYHFAFTVCPSNVNQ